MSGLAAITRVGKYVYNAREDFEAPVDGVTDARAALQLACDAVPDTGGTVYLPTGTYLVTGSIRPKSNTVICGDGYGTQIKCPTAGWFLVATTNIGIINIDNKSNVRVQNLRITGTKSADINNTPKLIYLEGTLSAPLENTQIINNDLDTTAFEGIWGGGLQTYTTNVLIQGNRIKNVGHPAGAFVGLPAIQPNSNYSSIIGNLLEDVGSGVAASGAFMVIANNLIRGVTSNGIGTGDNFDGGVTTIIGNVIEFTERVTGNARKGILMDGVSGTDHVINVVGNTVRVIGTSSIGDSECYSVVTAEHVNLVGNTAEIQVRGVGFITLGKSTGSHVTFKNNTVRVVAENGASYGLRGIPNGSGNTLNLVSADNRVYGLTRTHASYAYDYSAPSGTLTGSASNDWAEQGFVKLADTIYGNGSVPALDKVPFSQSFPIGDFSQYIRYPKFSILNIQTPVGSMTIASGAINISGLNSGEGFPYRQTRIVLDTESSAATDDLDTISGGTDGDILILRTVDSGRDITVKHNTGNILCASDFTLSSTSDRIVLLYDGGLSKWIELSRWSPVLNVATAYQVAGTQVVQARETGWTGSTGTANKGAYATYSGQDVSAAYTESEIQAIDDALKAATQRIKALEDMARTHGLIN